MERTALIAATLAAGALLAGCGSSQPGVQAAGDRRPSIFRQKKRQRSGPLYRTREDIEGPEVLEEALRFRARKANREDHAKLVDLLGKLRRSDLYFLPIESEIAELAATSDLPVADYAQQLLLHRKSHVRSAAVRLVGKYGTMKHFPKLLARLSDKHADVRRNAASALRARTGRSFGYHHRAAPGKRAEAIQQWREWYATDYKKNKHRKRER